MFYLHVCLCTCVPCACGSQKRALCLQELESQMVGSHQVGAVLSTQALWKSSNGSCLSSCLSSSLCSSWHCRVGWSLIHTLFRLGYQPFVLHKNFLPRMECPLYFWLKTIWDINKDYIMIINVFVKGPHMVLSFFFKICFHFHLCVCMCVCLWACVTCMQGLLEDGRGRWILRSWSHRELSPASYGYRSQTAVVWKSSVSSYQCSPALAQSWLQFPKGHSVSWYLSYIFLKRWCGIP